MSQLIPLCYGTGGGGGSTETVLFSWNDPQNQTTFNKSDFVGYTDISTMVGMTAGIKASIVAAYNAGKKLTYSFECLMLSESDSAYQNFEFSAGFGSDITNGIYFTLQQNSESVLITSGFGAFSIQKIGSETLFYDTVATATSYGAVVTAAQYWQSLIEPAIITDGALYVSFNDGSIAESSLWFRQITITST